MTILSKCQDIKTKPDRIPNFTKTNKDGIKEATEKEFSYTIMSEVANLSTGQSFGELALMMNQKRNASIKAVSETHFAVIEFCCYFHNKAL